MRTNVYVVRTVRQKVKDQTVSEETYAAIKKLKNKS